MSATAVNISFDDINSRFPVLVTLSHDVPGYHLLPPRHLLHLSPTPPDQGG